MNRLFLMCGISFSGKTTLAQEISREIGAPIISLDAINHERGLGMDGHAVSDEDCLVFEIGSEFKDWMERMKIR